MIGIGLNIGNRVMGGFDSSASAFFTATGITGATEQQAVNTLVTSLKSAGLWSKMKAVYPFVTDNRNLLSYTEDFSNGVWTKNNATITANDTTAPNGTLTADKIIPNTTLGAHSLYQSITVTATTYAMSFYAKRAGYTGIRVANLATGVGARFDLLNGVLGTVSAGVTASIENVGNDWYRCIISFTPTVGANLYGFYVDQQVNVSSYAGNGTDGIFVWGAQLELGSTATTYQPIATTQQSYISNQFKYNLVNPVDSDAAFRGVFNGGWTFSNQGALPNGTNGYMDTKLVPSSVLAQNSASVGIYSRTNNTALTSRIEIGSSNATVDFQESIRWDGSLGNLSRLNNGYIGGTSGYVTTKTSGFFTTSRTASTITKKYEDGILKETTADTSASPNSVSVYLGARNNSGVGAFYDAKQYAFAHIADGLTDTESTALYNAVQTFNTSLSRQV